MKITRWSPCFMQRYFSVVRATIMTIHMYIYVFSFLLQVDADNIEGDATVQRLRKEVYNYEDSVTINESLPNYQQLVSRPGYNITL